MNTQNSLLNFVLIIGTLVVGMHFVTKAFHPKLNAWYHKMLRKVANFLRKKFVQFIRWAWREHKKFIIGMATGMIVIWLCYTGHF